MPFKVYVRSEIAEGLDETCRIETWAGEYAGSAYHELHRAGIEAYETCVPTLRKVLAGPRRRILESGCGSGRWISYLEHLGHEVIGIDDSAAPLSAARKHAANLQLVRADVRRTPFGDGSFDAVFSSYVAEHFEEGPDVVLRECRRLLKPEGLLLLIVPYTSWFRRLVTHRILQGYYLAASLRGRPLTFTEYRFSRAETERALSRCGFRVEHVEPDDHRLPLSKGLGVDFGRWVLPRADSWELNAAGRALARALNAISPWTCCSGIFVVARARG